MELTEQHITNFDQLFKDYYPMSVLYARKMVNDLDSAREIAQQVFVKLYEKKDQLTIKTSIKSYIFQATRNTALNYIKQQKTRQFAATHAMSRYETETNEDTLLTKELEEQILSIIDRLPNKCKQIFTMNRFEGKKNKEIAQELDISIRTVETQISKALKTLRNELPKYLKIILLSVYILFI